MSATVAPDGTCALCHGVAGSHAVGCELAALRTELQLSRSAEQRLFELSRSVCFCTDCESTDPIKVRIRVKLADAEARRAGWSLLWSIIVGVIVTGLGNIAFTTMGDIRDNVFFFFAALMAAVLPAFVHYSEYQRARSRASLARKSQDEAIKNSAAFTGDEEDEDDTR